MYKKLSNSWDKIKAKRKYLISNTIYFVKKDIIM